MSKAEEYEWELFLDSKGERPWPLEFKVTIGPNGSYFDGGAEGTHMVSDYGYKSYFEWVQDKESYPTGLVSIVCGNGSKRWGRLKEKKRTDTKYRLTGEYSSDFTKKYEVERVKSIFRDYEGFSGTLRIEEIQVEV